MDTTACESLQSSVRQSKLAGMRGIDVSHCHQLGARCCVAFGLTDVGETFDNFILIHHGLDALLPSSRNEEPHSRDQKHPVNVFVLVLQVFSIAGSIRQRQRDCFWRPGCRDAISRRRMYDQQVA